MRKKSELVDWAKQKILVAVDGALAEHLNLEIYDDEHRLELAELNRQRERVREFLGQKRAYRGRP